MNITVNGKRETLESLCTVTEYLKSKNIRPGTVVIEHNGEIPQRDKWDSVTLREGDELEILVLMGGG